MLFISPYDTLSAGKKLHLAGRLVDVTVAAADRAIERRLLAGYGTVLPVC